MKKLSLLLTLVIIWTCSSPTKSKPAPQPPTVNNLSITTNEDTPATFTMTGSDPEGAALTFSISTQPTNGTVSISGAAGTYTPKENYHGQDTFAYIASDGTLSSTAGLVSVTITAVDDDPNTMDVTATTDEDTSVTITLEAEEVDGDNITFQLKTNPSNGSVTISGNQATYTPNENYYGSDSFTFEAVDSSAKRIINVATASITINPVNDAPMVNPSEAEAYDNAGINLDIEVTDVDDENITLQIVDQPKNISASINGLTLEVDNPNLYWGTDELTISAYDGTDYSETVTISLGFKRNINYNIPSSDFTNNISPWFDLAGIVDGLGFTNKDSYNTNAAYADFNGDNYFDIMIQPNVNDGVPVNTFFLINNGDNTFYIDNDFPININTSAISSRKTIVGDFNLDGKPDVVRPQGGHDWLGKPTITLSNENVYDFNLIESAPEIQAHGLCSGDIDNDGDLDIFFANAGMYDGFAINDGNGNFSWKWITEVIDGMDSGWMYPDGGYGYYGFWTSDMSDIDNDGFVDLILGGTYKDIHYDPNLDGATILWGDGSGSFSFNRATVLFVARELNYINYSNGQKFSTQDFAIADINMDGLKDVALKNPFISSGNFHQVFLAKGDRVFEDVTLNVFNGIFKFDSSNYVWLNLRDLDNNGLIELIEQEPVISVPTYESSSGWRKSFIWEWTGSSFIRRQ